jgi:hypothetical protein
MAPRYYSPSKNRTPSVELALVRCEAHAKSAGCFLTFFGKHDGQFRFDINPAFLTRPSFPSCVSVSAKGAFSYQPGATPQEFVQRQTASAESAIHSGIDLSGIDDERAH